MADVIIKHDVTDSSVTVHCPHCDSPEIYEYDVAVRWNSGEFSMKEGALVAVWRVSDDGEFNGDGYICGECLSRDIDMPADHNHVYAL